MSGGTLHICPACHEYTLSGICPHCGGKTQSPRPPRYSPEDKYGEYRRRLKALDASEKAAAAATPTPAATAAAKPAKRGASSKGTS